MSLEHFLLCVKVHASHVIMCQGVSLGHDEILTEDVAQRLNVIEARLNVAEK